MRALIPAAGIGTRLRPQTHSKPKALIQVAGKPVLGHIIEEYIDTPIKEIVMIVGYKSELIEQYLLDNYSKKFKFKNNKSRIIFLRNHNLPSKKMHTWTSTSVQFRTSFLMVYLHIEQARFHDNNCIEPTFYLQKSIRFL